MFFEKYIVVDILIIIICIIKVFSEGITSESCGYKYAGDCEVSQATERRRKDGTMNKKELATSLQKAFEEYPTVSLRSFALATGTT